MLQPGTLLQNRYEVIQVIGQGGMGAVYKAIDTRLRSTVALKETMVTGDVAQRAFEREAQLLASLRHHALPKVSDHFADERGTFLVMEFIPGEDLAALLAAQGVPFTLNNVLSWIDQLLDALEYLHSRQPPVIHRDIKPQNLKLTDRNEIILLDFGLAKGTVGQARLNTASVFGYTPHFAPLEQIQGVGTDPRSDLYSLAATMYQLLTNQIPADALTRASARINDEKDPLIPPHVLNPAVPKPMSDVLMLTMSQKSDTRPASATHLRQALRDPHYNIGPIAGTSYTAVFPLSSSSIENTAGASSNTLLDANLTSPSTVIPSASPQPSPFLGRLKRYLSNATRKGAEALLNHLKSQTAITPSPPSTEPVTGSSPPLPNRETTLQSAPPVVPAPSPAPHPAPQSSGIPAGPVGSAPLPPGNLLDGLPIPAISSTIHLRPQMAAHAPTSTLRLRYPSMIRRSEQHLFEELILHEDYERIWGALAYAEGGRFLLTGYGPFGATSLLQCAMEQARQELEKHGYSNGAMVALRFVVKNETPNSFDLEADTLTLGHPQLSDKVKQSQQWNTLRAKAATYGSDSISAPLGLQLSTPLGATFLNLASNATVASQSSQSGYDFIQFVAELNAFFKQRQDHRVLYRIITRFIGSSALPSRLVIIVDRVQYLETIKSLLQSELLQSERILLFVVARKEDYDTWASSDGILEKLKFWKWYVPCIWTVDLSHKLLEDMQGLVDVSDPRRETFRKHLEFKGRGSLGLYVQEIRNPHYTNLGANVAVIDLENLLNKIEVRHNAWLQDFLDVHWSFILSDMFFGRHQGERQDRARIGVYHTIDWIANTYRFTEAELHKAVQSLPITIAADTNIVATVLQHLLQSLTYNKYLQRDSDGYRVVWSGANPPVVRLTQKRKANSKPTTQSPKRRRGKGKPTGEEHPLVPINDQPLSESQQLAYEAHSSTVPVEPTSLSEASTVLSENTTPGSTHDNKQNDASPQTVLFADDILDRLRVSPVAAKSPVYPPRQPQNSFWDNVEHLDIQLLQDEGNPSEFTVLVLSSPSGEPQARSAVPYSREALVAILKALQIRQLDEARFTAEQTAFLQQQGLIKNGLIVPDMRERVGKTLYDSLFIGKIRTALVFAQQKVRPEKGTVNIRLRFNEDAVDLARLPWELMHSGQQYLTASGAVELTRYITFPQAPTPLQVAAPLHLLYVAPRPDIDGLPLLPDTEGLKMRRALQYLEGQGMIRVSMLQRSTYQAFINFLDAHQDVHILHFDGHGTFARRCPYCWENYQRLHYPHMERCDRCGADISDVAAQGFLAFEQDTEDFGRGPSWIDSTQLGNDLYSARQLRLAMLSACSSATVREATLFNGIGPMLIQAGIPAVVATQLPISADSASLFSEGFYEALTRQQPISAAVNAGRRRLTRRGEWFIPVLYLRSGDRRSVREEHQLFRLILGE